MTGGQAAEIVEYTDPLCPWAWGSEPSFRRLRAQVDGRIPWRRVYSILFDEDEDPAPDPDAETAWYAGYIAQVAEHTGAPRAARLERVARTSWPASLAARAAEAQGPAVAAHVLRRLRESVFVLGEPADTPERVLDSVRCVPGLDLDRLREEASSAAVRASVCADRAEARSPVPEVLGLVGPPPHPGRARELDDGGHRYALPTIVIRGSGGRRVVPGLRPPQAYTQALLEACPGFATAVAECSAEELIRFHRTLTARELELLTVDGAAPEGAVRVDTAGGPLWLDPQEAAVHPALVRRGGTGGRPTPGQ